MRPETQDKLRKIRRVGKNLHGLCKGLIALTTLILVLIVIRIFTGGGATIDSIDFSLSPGQSITAFGVAIPLASLAIAQRVVVAVIITLTFAIDIKALLNLSRLFQLYSLGDVFTVEAAEQIRQIGIAFILRLAPNIFWVLASFAFAAQRMPVSIHLEIAPVALGLAIIFVSWFMDAAADLREENELTV